MVVTIVGASYAWWLELLPISMWLGVISLIFYTGSLFRRHHICLNSTSAITALAVPLGGKEWQLIQADEVVQIGHLSPDSLCLSWILLLHFKLVSGGNRLVVLTPCSINLSEFKGLQRRLMFMKE